MIAQLSVELVLISGIFIAQLSGRGVKILNSILTDSRPSDTNIQVATVDHVNLRLRCPSEVNYLACDR